MGAGTSFLGYLQHIITTHSGDTKADNCWDDYETHSLKSLNLLIDSKTTQRTINNTMLQSSKL